MVQHEIASAAFRDAQLRSERLRVFGIVIFVIIFLLIAIVRVFVVRTVARSAFPVWDLALPAGIILYELWMLRRINRALHEGRSLASWFWVLSTILETSIPAVVIAFLSSREIEAAYRPVATPALLGFFIFIILSTLRLTNWICYLSGAVAAVTYVSAALHLGWRPPVPGIAASPAQTSVTSNAILFLVGGAVAGIVAGQIRKFIEAALREAETKRKLATVEHDLQVARSIQQSLLPKEKPQIAGFDIAGWNKSADDTSGDYFDWVSLPNGNLVAMLADVTGHGIGPALLAAVCRAYARASFNVEPDISSALAHINQALARDLTVGRFVTFVAAVCGSNGKDTEILSAGHGPLFIYSRSEDSFMELTAHAVPFGILPIFNSEPPTKVQLQPGDMLLLATDGFYEWENDMGEQFGAQRLMDAVRASRDLPSPEIIAKLHEAVIQFSNGTRQQDDLTAVLIKGV